MTPTPTNEDNRNNNNSSLSTDASTTSLSPQVEYWTKENTAVTVVFAVLALTTFVLLLSFYLCHRSQKKKQADGRSDQAALLVYTKHMDRPSMFSRERHNSMTLYVDEEHEARRQRVRSDNMSLIPLQVRPAEQRHDAMAEPAPASHGSGVSSMSRLSLNTTSSTMMLSPISPTEDGHVRVGQTARPRSTSSASQRARRYYESMPKDVARPPVPVIIRTASG
ncbi:hypothetical protein ACEQ8H_005564 [Pleosporales sp. CAS-2024a]